MSASDNVSVNSAIFLDWIERHLPDALGYPVFSLGQKITVKLNNRQEPATVEEICVIAERIGAISVHYMIVVDTPDCEVEDWFTHDELLRLSPKPDNPPD